jgi:large subunit ribosomal protein L3
LDNHVIRYIPPEEYGNTQRGARQFRNRKPLGCLVVGAEATNPEKVIMEDLPKFAIYLRLSQIVIN